ncbi:MAG: RNA methyltransferase [Lentisphaeria bacterium]|nr:RNA methyltransferase [Lentisphaeria bacterium]
MTQNSPSRRELSLLRALLTRGGRKRSNCCRCEGVRAVEELLARRKDLVQFIVATQRGIDAMRCELPEVKLLSEEEFSQYSDTLNSQGIIAVAEIPESPDTPVAGDFILALDQLNDPGNFGTISRTYRAIGGQELWYTKGSVDPWCDKAIRSGMGAQFSLNVRKFDDLQSLCDAAEKAGFQTIYIADPHKGESCFTAEKLFKKSVLVIGSEANGVSMFPENSRSVMIPMPGDYESLNAAQAATVLLLEYVRRNTQYI